MQVYVPNENLPAVFKDCAEEMIQRLVEAAQLAAALREMRSAAAAKNISLPAFDIPDLWDITDRESLPCRLAVAAMESGIIEGVEEWLSSTPL